MARATLVFSLIALASALPEGCTNLVAKWRGAASPAASAAPSGSQSESVAPAVPTSTAPPVWTPPDPGGPLPKKATAPVSPDLAKARALADAGAHKKIRALLEKKVKAGKGDREEAAILLEACIALRDKACVDAVKAKHPDVDVRR
ncbi:MAG TPA: hypothetical protein VM580_21385 [Labilithrix sp.]|nr:hypothetical protein [Labilithrix sp.]